MKKHTKASDYTLYLNENTFLGKEYCVASKLAEPFLGSKKILQTHYDVDQYDTDTFEKSRIENQEKIINS